MVRSLEPHPASVTISSPPNFRHSSRQISVRPTVLFIALAFGINIGSVLTPIGNPQNLLIVIKSNIPLPFLTFVKWLFIPTMINLFLTYFILKVYFKGELSKLPYNRSGNGEKVVDNRTNDERLLLTNAITNPRLAKISVIILLFTIAGFVISEVLQFHFHVVYFSISVIAVLGDTALYAFSRQLWLLASI